MAVLLPPTVPFVRIDRKQTDAGLVGWPTAFGAAVGRALGVLRHKDRADTQPGHLPESAQADAGITRARVTAGRPTGYARSIATERR